MPGSQRYGAFKAIPFEKGRVSAVELPSSTVDYLLLLKSSSTGARFDCCNSSSRNIAIVS